MNRLYKCIHFQTKQTFIGTSIFLGFYVAIYLFSFLLLNSTSNSSGSATSSFFIAGGIFTFVTVSSAYKARYNYLMMFGNTRKTIFLSSLATNLIFSAAMAVLSILFELLDLGLSQVSDRFHAIGLLGMLYQNNPNMASELFWFFFMFIMISAFSMLYGALRYKIGKVFTVIFWVAFGLSWMVVPMLLGINGLQRILQALKFFFQAGVSNGIFLAPVNFLIAAVVCGTAACLLSIRQPQMP